MRTQSILVALLVLPMLACGEPSEGSDEVGESGTSTEESGSESETETETETTADVETETTADAETETETETESSTTTGGEDCTKVEVMEWIGLGEGADTIIALTIPQLGDPGLNDLVQLELYAEPELGVAIDLSLAPSANYATCDLCARLLEDVTGNVIDKQYFVEAGTITFQETMNTGEWLGVVEDLRFVEVTLDGQFNSTPVPGGACIELDGESPFDTLPGG